MFAKAIKEYEAEDDSNITIKKGDLVVVTDRSRRRLVGGVRFHA